MQHLADLGSIRPTAKKDWVPGVQGQPVCQAWPVGVKAANGYLPNSLRLYLEVAKGLGAKSSPSGRSALLLTLRILTSAAAAEGCAPCSTRVPAAGIPAPARGAAGATGALAAPVLLCSGMPALAAAVAGSVDTAGCWWTWCAAGAEPPPAPNTNISARTEGWAGGATSTLPCGAQTSGGGHRVERRLSNMEGNGGMQLVWDSVRAADYFKPEALAEKEASGRKHAHLLRRCSWGGCSGCKLWQHHSARASSSCERATCRRRRALVGAWGRTTQQEGPCRRRCGGGARGGCSRCCWPKHVGQHGLRCRHGGCSCRKREEGA
jgi:hypothetical protein